jgi:hypothetical protein
MARLDRATSLNIVLLLVARSSRAMTCWGRAVRQSFGELVSRPFLQKGSFTTKTLRHRDDKVKRIAAILLGVLVSLWLTFHSYHQPNRWLWRTIDMPERSEDRLHHLSQHHFDNVDAGNSVDPDKISPISKSVDRGAIRLRHENLWSSVPLSSPKKILAGP